MHQESTQKIRTISVALITRHKKGTGIGNYTSYLYAGYKNLGLKVRLIYVNIPGKRLPEIAAPIWIAYRLLKVKADVFHADYTDAGLGAIIASKKPLVVTVHDDIPHKYPKDRHPLWVFLYKLSFMIVRKKCDAIITISNHSKNDLEKRLNQSLPIHVAYNGVDHSKYFPIENNVTNKCTTIGYLGSLATRKRVDRLIDAYALLFQHNINIELRIGGVGGNLQLLVDKVKKLGLKNVEFLGFIPDRDMNSFYNGLEIFVFPSDYEGFGLPILEAMACGIPVVTTDTSCMPEIVEDAGLITKPNPKALANGIKKLIENQELRKQMREIGLARAKKFSWERTAKESYQVYENVFEKHL